MLYVSLWQAARLVIPLSLAASCFGAEASCTVWGSVFTGYPISGLSIELSGLANDHTAQRVAVDEYGHFEFQAAPPGAYEIRLTDHSGAVLLKGEVPLTGELDPLYLQVGHSAATVSVAKLLRKVPDSALKAYKKACGSRRGDVKRTIEFLEKAVAIAPNFPEAENDLGALYSALGQNEQAVRHFERAVELDDTFEEACYNLARKLIDLDRYAECEKVLRPTLDRNHASPELQMLLAICTIIRGVDIPEAVNTLNRLGDRYPVERLNAAEVFRRTGHYRLSADQLQAYVKTSNLHRCDRQRIERVLESLQSAASAASQVAKSSQPN